MDLSKQTQANYKAAYAYMRACHKSRFADLRLQNFQRMVDKAEKMGRSRSTMEKIKALAVILSKYANSQDIVGKVYAQGIRLPKAKKHHMDTFSETEIQTLFHHDDDFIVQTVLILIYTGMRISELLSLTKFNVDVDRMLITGGVKTDAGDRVIPITP